MKKMSNNFYAYGLGDDQLALQQKRYLSGLQQIELKNQVIATHETYLQLDDNDQRDEYRKKLHKYVVDFLLKIPHPNKFTLPDFNFIFDKCIEGNPLFEPLKAAESFDVLFRIANNLILKPWRQEFHRINIYNAYFTHLVSEQIPHYEHILKLMGYSLHELRSKQGVLNYHLVKRNSLDMLKLISFDCFICYVELRYLYQFGEILKGKNIKPNWRFILSLRKKFTGDFESTLENYLLIYQDHLVEYESSRTAGDQRHELLRANEARRSDGDLKITTRSEPKSDLGNLNSAEQQINQKYRHLNNLISQYGQSSAERRPATHSNLIDLDSLPASINSYDSLEQLLLNSSSNSFQPTASYNHQPIHIAGQSHLHSSLGHSASISSNHSGASGSSYLQCSDNHPSIRQRPQNGHTQPQETDLDQVDFIDDSPLTADLKNELNSKIKCLDSNAQKLEIALRSDNDKLNSSLNSGLVNGKIKSNSLEKKSKVNKSAEKKYSTLDCRGEKKKEKTSKTSILSSVVKKKEDTRWPCSHCTFLNDPKDEICKMCSKSNKSISGKNELSLLGKQCDLCTLVNKRNEQVCVACGSSLKDSPTYI